MSSTRTGLLTNSWSARYQCPNEVQQARVFNDSLVYLMLRCYGGPGSYRGEADSDGLVIQRLSGDMQYRDTSVDKSVGRYHIQCEIKLTTDGRSMMRWREINGDRLRPDAKGRVIAT